MIEPTLASRLPDVGTTIFTTISQMAQTHGAINLGQGFPDFDPPVELLSRLHHHVTHGANQYAPMAGAPKLLEAIAHKLHRVYGRVVSAQTEVTVTCGGTEALAVTIQALVHPGDEVVLLDPAYDSYAPMIRLCGGKTIRVPLNVTDLTVDWARVNAAINSKTRLLIVNNPHNPSGASFIAEDLDALESIVARWPIWLVADEVYEHMVFDQQRHQSLHLRQSLWGRAIVVASFGKTYHVTGWKIGYVVAPPAVSAEIRKVHQFVTFAISHPMQLALADFLNAHPEWEQELVPFYTAKRDRLNAWLIGSRFTFIPSKATYFQIVDYSAISDAPDVDFVTQLITEHGVAAIPMSVFYEEPPKRQHIRLCFAKSDAVLDAGGARLRAL